MNPESRLPRLLPIVFATFLTLWSVALLLPVPNESANKALGGPLWVFLFGKSLHVSAYAFLATLGGLAFLHARRGWWVYPGLVLHGAIAEYLQGFVGRTASVRDVILDAAGVLLGFLLIRASRRLWARKAPSAKTASPVEAAPRVAFPLDRLPIAGSSSPRTTGIR